MDWVKIKCNLLDHRKIKLVRRGQEGNTLVLLWLLMLTEAGKCNRGGYLMVSDSLPYTVETLSMVTDIPLPTVQLGIVTFSGLDMIDQRDGAIFIKNWGKYQSQDKLEARRENDRKRQQLHRDNEREKLRVHACQEQVSRDSHVNVSRDITPENREDEIRSETTINEARLLLAETPLSRISNQELQGLAQRHGSGRLLQAADVAAETWRRNRDELHNPGGYLQSLCASLVVPEWFVPCEERKAQAEAFHLRRTEAEAKEAGQREQEEALNAARNAFWESLEEERQKLYLTAAKADLPEGIALSIALIAKARLLAWDAANLDSESVVSVSRGALG